LDFSHGLEGALAYDSWFDAAWGRYAFAVESRAILRAAGRIDGLRVLDVGCGTGRMTQVLASRGARVAGLDLDAAMLTVAARWTSAPLILGDAAALPFSAASFDVTVAVTLCEFVADVGAVFAELARVTRPGGRFIVGSLNPRSPWGWVGRKRFVEAPWTEARFLSRRQLLDLGTRHGKASLSGVLFAPEGLPGLNFLSPPIEAIGRLSQRHGAFQVLTVELPA
jgi:ubiquinone/menaquinone biosynthesis C-methylase UbiE